MKQNQIALALATALFSGLTAFSNGGETDVTGAYAGTAGAPGSHYNYIFGTGGFYSGNSGGVGYSANGAGNNFVFGSAAISGGAGGAVVAPDAPNNLVDYSMGGNGGTAVNLSSDAVFNSGTFAGGSGGPISGSALATSSGPGGTGVSVTGTPTVVINGGSFIGGNAGANSSASTQYRDTAGGTGLSINGKSAITVYGGVFAGGTSEVTPNYYSNSSPSSGIFDEGGIVNIYGGSFTGAAASDYGPGPGISLDSLYTPGGTINLYGTGFMVNGVPVSSETVTADFGTITGTLEDNSGQAAITFQYDNGYVRTAANGGTINLIDISVPEPASLFSFVALGLSLLRRRR